MVELASYDIALDTETYATNAHLPAMRDFFSEINKYEWFERVNGSFTGNTTHTHTKHGFSFITTEVDCTERISVAYNKFISDEVGFGKYEDFSSKEKPFRISNLNKMGTAAAIGAAVAAIPGEIVEGAAAVVYAAYVGYKKMNAYDYDEKYYAKIPFMPYKTRMGDILDNLIKDGATELIEDGNPLYKDLKINERDSHELKFGPDEKGNTLVMLTANEDTLHVSLSLYGKSSKEDGNLILSVLSYADSHGLDIDFKNETTKSYFETHKNDTWWDKTKKSVSDLFGRKKD